MSTQKVEHEMWNTKKRKKKMYSLENNVHYFWLTLDIINDE